MDRRTYILKELEKSFPIESCLSIVDVLFEDISNLESIDKEEIDKIISRVASGEPVQYVTGIAPFYGYFFTVDNNVLIPRPETEELVYTVEKYIKKKELFSASILDIGTGSGCIPITLSKLFPETSILAIDVSEEALNVAKANSEKLGAKVSFQPMDFLDQDTWKELGGYDIIISNPPYIPQKEDKLMSANVLDHEPHLALFVENNDPLIFYRKIFEYAQSRSKNSAIFLECNEFNASEVQQLFGLEYTTTVLEDLQGKDRMVQALPNEN